MMKALVLATLLLLTATGQASSADTHFSLRSCPSSPFDPVYDPFNNIRGYEDFSRAFINANSNADVACIKRRIDAELRDKAILAHGGALGIVALLLAALLDPLILLGLCAVLLTARRIDRVGQGALAGGSIMGACVLVQEILLHMTQFTRTGFETMPKLLLGMVIGGLIGGTTVALKHRWRDKRTA